MLCSELPHISPLARADLAMAHAAAEATSGKGAQLV
jgi:hypothetical protein